MSAHPFVFHYKYRTLPFPRKRLLQKAQELTRGERLNPACLINVVLCSDAVIRTLNRKFRKKDKPTDVLSFNYNEKDILGEIYISLQRVAIQSRHYGISYEEELERLLVHGVLHLQGFDHHQPAERTIMERHEARYNREHD